MAGGIPSLRLPQSRKWRIAILVGVLCLTGWIIWRVTEDEPQYHGHGLWHWYKLSQSKDFGEQFRGKVAIRAIGTNSIPYLIKILDRGPSKLNDWLAWASYKSSGKLPRWQPIPDENDAALVLEILNTNAVAAVPALVESMKYHPWGLSSPPIQSQILSQIGPAALPAVITALTNTNENIRGNASYGLKYFFWYSGKYEENFQLLLHSLFKHPDRKAHDVILNTLKSDSHPSYGKPILFDQFKTSETNNFPIVLELLKAWHGTNNQTILENLAELRNQVDLEKQALIDYNSRQFLSQKNTNTPPTLP